jgi:predicted hydrocarbon binding protein
MKERLANREVAFFVMVLQKIRMCVRSQSNYWIRLYSIYQLNLKYKLHKQLEATGMDQFTFTDMKKIKRKKLGNVVPLELFRTIRLIGLYQALPMNGKGTTLTIGRKIGEEFGVTSVNELFELFEQLKIGIPIITHEDDKGMTIAVHDCFCEGLPIMEGKMVCDLEGAIIEGALTKIRGKRVSVREIKCNVNGDEYCEYIVKY